MRKRFLGILLAVAVVFTLLPTDSITVSAAAKSVTVSTEKKLKSALKNKNYTKITISTKKKVSFSVPKGSYKKKQLVVNAPKSSMKNSGVFKSIKIQGIAKNTWTENANDNKITMTASTGRIIVPEGIEVGRLTLSKSGMKLNLDVEGEIDELVVNKDADVDAVVNGNIDYMTVNAKTDLNIMGDSKTVIPVTVAGSADDTGISTSVPVNLSTAADTKVFLVAGAGNTDIRMLDQTKNLEVNNNSGSTLKIVSAIGGVKSLLDNTSATYTGDGSVTGMSGKQEDDETSSEPHVTNRFMADNGSGGARNTEVSVPAFNPLSNTSLDYRSTTPYFVTDYEKAIKSAESNSENTEENEETGKKTPVVTRYQKLPAVKLTKINDILPTRQEVIDNYLPKTVLGYADNGSTYRFTITDWDDDGYSSLQPVAKMYRFKATLKQRDSVINNAGDFYVSVYADLVGADHYVKNQSNKDSMYFDVVTPAITNYITDSWGNVISNTNETVNGDVYSADATGGTAINPTIIDGRNYVKIRYTGNGYRKADISIKYYDEYGEPSTTITKSAWFSTNGETQEYVFDYPKNSRIQTVTNKPENVTPNTDGTMNYTFYDILIQGSEENFLTDATSDITTVPYPYGSKYYIKTDQDGNYYALFTVRNNNTRTIANGSVIAKFYDKNDKLVGVDVVDISGTPGKNGINTTASEVEAKIPYGIYDKPYRVDIRCQYANVLLY